MGKYVFLQYFQTIYYLWKYSFSFIKPFPTINYQGNNGFFLQLFFTTIHSGKYNFLNLFSKYYLRKIDICSFILFSQWTLRKILSPNPFQLAVSHDILSLVNLNKSWMDIFTCSRNASDWSLNPIDMKNWTTSSVVHLEASGYFPFSILGNVDRPFVVVSFLKKDLKIKGNITKVQHPQQYSSYQSRPTCQNHASKNTFQNLTRSTTKVQMHLNTIIWCVFDLNVQKITTGFLVMLNCNIGSGVEHIQ